VAWAIKGWGVKGRREEEKGMERRRRVVGVRKKTKAAKKEWVEDWNPLFG